MKLDRAARVAVRDENVVASGIFNAGGSLTARMSGFGEFSVRRREREERASSGLPFKRYMLLVLTPSRLHIFDARSQLTGWKAGRSLATWDRSAVRATTDPKSMTTRLTLEIPSESRRIQLEAPKARRGTAGEVARLLASGTLPICNREAEPSIQRPISPADRKEAEGWRLRHDRAGWVAIGGALVRLMAYSLPWLVVSPLGAGSSIHFSGWRVLGGPWLSIAYPIVIIVAGGFYLAGRREATPRLLWNLGIGSIIVFLIQFPVTLSRMGSLRTAVQAQRLAATVSLGFGVWVELVGAILTFGGGLYAIRLSKRTGYDNAAPGSPRADGGLPLVSSPPN